MKIFLTIVKFIANLLGYDIFCAVSKNGVGHSVYSNSGCDAIRNLRHSQIEWERSHAFDPDECW